MTKKVDYDDIYVRLMNLPDSVRGFVSESADGTYNVYINAKLSYEMQKQVVKHEVEHIRENHLYSDKKLVEIE